MISLEVSPLAHCNGNGQRGTTVWFNCNQMWREECSTLWSVASGWLIIVIWLYCGSNWANVTGKKLKGAAVCLLFAAVCFTGQSGSFQSEVRGHWSVTVVQMRAFPGTIRASPDYSKGILFTWQTWQRMYKPTIKTMHIWFVYFKELYVLSCAYNIWNWLIGSVQIIFVLNHTKCNTLPAFNMLTKFCLISVIMSSR